MISQDVTFLKLSNIVNIGGIFLDKTTSNNGFKLKEEIMSKTSNNKYQLRGINYNG